MEIKVRKYEDGDIADMVRIWNQVVEDGVAFPQEDFLTEETGREFFARQDTCGAAVNETGRVVGMYILHTRITSGAAGIWQTPAMPSAERNGEPASAGLS